MAYSGSTAASSVANPPRAMIQSVGGSVNTTGLTTAPNAPGAQGGGLWFYSSTDPVATVLGTDYFSDGKNLGMKPGDVVIGVSFTSAGSSVITYMGAITGVSTSGASLSTGSVYTSTFA